MKRVNAHLDLADFFFSHSFPLNGRLQKTAEKSIQNLFAICKSCGKSSHEGACYLCSRCGERHDHDLPCSVTCEKAGCKPIYEVVDYKLTVVGRKHCCGWGR